MSAYNTWMCSYGKDESGKLIEPEPWQLHYIGCGLLFDSSSEHSDAHGQTCKGMCRAEPGALVVKAADSTLFTILASDCCCCPQLCKQTRGYPIYLRLAPAHLLILCVVFSLEGACEKALLVLRCMQGASSEA
eukprot:16034-Heterococcus_DN1.PRE.1